MVNADINATPKVEASTPLASWEVVRETVDLARQVLTGLSDGKRHRLREWKTRQIPTARDVVLEPKTWPFIGVRDPKLEDVSLMHISQDPQGIVGCTVRTLDTAYDRRVKTVVALDPANSTEVRFAQPLGFAINTWVLESEGPLTLSTHNELQVVLSGLAGQLK